MISSWKEFWLSEQRIYIVLCLAGTLVGLITGNAVAGWSEYFPTIEIFNKYQIPALISFGMIVALATQIVLPSRRKTIELSCRYVELYFQSELKSVIVDFQRSF
jgi:Na+/glutamate symporter